MNRFGLPASWTLCDFILNVGGVALVFLCMYGAYRVGRAIVRAIVRKVRDGRR